MEFDSPALRTDNIIMKYLNEFDIAKTYLNEFVGNMVNQSAAAQAHSGAMIALVPEEPTAWRLAHPDYEVPDILHVTLKFLGKSDDWDEEPRLSLLGRAGEVAAKVREYGPITGNVWATASFNPYGSEPCAAYLVGGHSLTVAHRLADQMLSPTTRPLVPEQHSPWVPHITIGYGLDSSQLTQATGEEIRFDRLRVSFGDQDVSDFPI